MADPATPLVVVAATANQHKLDEMRAVFGASIELLPRPAEVPEVVEDADSFVGNARLKAVAIAEASGHVALADDSGLEVDALDGAPGVESAYYGGGDHDDAANRARLVSELSGVAVAQRTARFRTVMVLRWPDVAKSWPKAAAKGASVNRRRVIKDSGTTRSLCLTAATGVRLASTLPTRRTPSVIAAGHV